MNKVIPNNKLPLGFNTGSKNNFTIRASEIRNFDSNTRIFLVDSINNSEQDITDGGEYNFSSDVVNTINRFSVIFRTSSVTTSIFNDRGDYKAISVYAKEKGKIIVTCTNDIVGKGNVMVCNIIGQIIENKLLLNQETVLSNSCSTGIYLVRVMADGKTTTHKIVMN